MIYMYEIHSWLITNKLSLNVIKTKYMIVASQYGIKHIERQFNIQVNHHYLTRDNSYVLVLKINHYRGEVM